MNWILLLLAGLMEVFWSSMMKLSNGFSILPYSIATIVGMILSFAFLITATKHLPLSIAYPIWTGIGAVGAVLVGVLCFHDPLKPTTLLFVVLLIISIIGIKLTAH